MLALASILVCNAELDAFNSAVVVNEPVSAAVKNELVWVVVIKEPVSAAVRNEPVCEGWTLASILVCNSELEAFNWVIVANEDKS